DILLVKDSFANVLMLIQETTERRVGTNARAKPEFCGLFPIAPLLLGVVFDILAACGVYSGKIAVAEIARQQGADLVKLLALFGIELVEFCHESSPRYSSAAAPCASRFPRGPNRAGAMWG